jgi:hypothetical protein
MTAKVHTRERDGEWVNEIEGEGEVSQHDTKSDAASFGRDLARERGAEHVIHGEGGTEERYDYGDGPLPAS